ncbi:hypothetical protein POVWA2_007900 [Plasmodium ovale wallikeri]|uniref:Uncharacterized protein n=1 Tax=Plasmodium ovale wallikeri TaxID=864142 RepID=A0A1A8YKQ5_PLAOA|nr:hypothetical protein POVWA1_007910 [Plasmodium ovale wallikeri]SBT32129.1 hypothetical protein POVWA2_007900 [Plasmodium ovale wallikeri]
MKATTGFGEGKGDNTRVREGVQAAKQIKRKETVHRYNCAWKAYMKKTISHFYSIIERPLTRRRRSPP